MKFLIVGGRLFLLLWDDAVMFLLISSVIYLSAMELFSVHKQILALFILLTRFPTPRFMPGTNLLHSLLDFMNTSRPLSPSLSHSLPFFSFFSLARDWIQEPCSASWGILPLSYITVNLVKFYFKTISFCHPGLWPWSHSAAQAGLR